MPQLNPVLARELKQRMRGRHIWLVPTLYLAVLALILRWVYVAASRTDRFDGGFNLLASASAGRAIFQWLLFFMLLLVCFIVPGLTAGAISGERERQTLIALQLTLLRPRSIVVGKLLASLAFVVLLIVASVPLLTVPFLVGGVSLPEVAKGLVMVLATAVTLACLTLACSALLRRTQAATVVAYGLTLGLALGTLMVYGAQQVPRQPGSPRPRPWILALNPFAATADVLQGRTDSGGFESPFQPLQSLLRLSDEDRLNQILDSGPAFGGSGPDFVVPTVVARPVPPPVAAVAAPPPGPATATTVGPGGVAAVPTTGVPRTVPEPATTIAPGTGPLATVPEPLTTIGPGPAPAPGFAIGVTSSDGISSSNGLANVVIRPDNRVRLAGVRFWLVSLIFWLVLAELAVVLTVRRIRLPGSRES